MVKSIKQPLTLIGSFLLILTAVTCTLGAVISAFSFEVDYRLLVLIWLIAALALTFLAYLWRGKGMLTLIPVALGFIIWKLPEIVEGWKWVAFFISREFNKWLVVRILYIDAKASVYELTLFFAAAGVILAFLVAVAVCLRRSSFLAVFTTAPIVFISFVLLNCQPDTRFLFGLLAVYFTLLISSALHPDDFQKRGRAVFPSLALALLLLGAAYLAAPPGGHKREVRMDSIGFQLRNFASRVGLTKVKYGVGWPAASAGVWSFNKDYVEIADAGTRIIFDQDILKINCSESGTFYLRGYSMQSFDGRSWTVNSDTLFREQERTANTYPALIACAYMYYNEGETPAKVVNAYMDIERIRDSSWNITYTPYYSLQSGRLQYGERMWYDDQFSDTITDYPDSLPYGGADSGANNDFLHTEYSILALAQDVRANIGGMWSIDGYSETYTEISDSTAQGLRRLAIEAGIDPGADRAIIADRVASYIRTSGQYTLTPYIIPPNEDFALFFLQQSKQGYCIHFATAATLMLRSLGVPARFTSGFAIKVPRESIGVTIPVTDRQAHSWVEVFYDGVGWLPLEVTPASAGSTVPGARPHAAAETPGPDSERDPDSTAPDRDYDDIQGSQPGDPDAAQGAGDSDAEHGQPWSIWIDILIVLVSTVAGCTVFLVLRRPIARNIRKKRFAQSNTNAAVICAWRHIVRLSGKKQPAEEIEELALKARFSQHVISEEERAEAIDYAHKLAGEARRSGKAKERLRLFVKGL